MAKLEIQSDVSPFTMIKNSIIDSEEILSEHEKLLYIVLLRYGNKAFPSLATLSKKCGFSKRTVQRTIDTLIDKGLLKKKNRVSKKNGNTSNVYMLIDSDIIWNSTKENLKENINSVILDEAIRIVETSGMKVFRKEKKMLASTEPTKVTVETSTKTKRNIFPTNNDSTTGTKSQDLERYTIDQIKQLFDYDVMVRDNPYRQQDIDSVMDILHTTMNTTKSTIRIAGEDKPSMVVIGKLMKLSYSEIIYAIEKYQEQTERIKNPTSYMLTLLYNAKEQMNLDITNQVSHDMAHWNTEE